MKHIELAGRVKAMTLRNEAAIINSVTEEGTHLFIHEAPDGSRFESDRPNEPGCENVGARLISVQYTLELVSRHRLPDKWDDVIELDDGTELKVRLHFIKSNSRVDHHETQVACVVQQ